MAWLTTGNIFSLSHPIKYKGAGIKIHPTPHLELTTALLGRSSEENYFLPYINGCLSEKIAKFSFSFVAAFLANVANNRNPVSKRHVYAEQYLPVENGSLVQASAVCPNKTAITPVEQSCQGVLLNRADRVRSLPGT